MKSKYITIMEPSNEDCPNVGTITNFNSEASFKEAVESYFDARLISFSFARNEIEKLTDCINAYPIDVIVKIDYFGDNETHILTLSQTFLY